MESKSVYIIIINYNNAADTISCVESLRKSKYENMNIVLIDNASTDDSLDLLRSIEQIELIVSEENKGFAHGNNIGITYALNNNADYIMLINNDTEVDDCMISNLVDAAGEEAVAVPKMFYYNKRDGKNIIWYAGGELDYKKGDSLHWGQNKEDESEYNIKQDITFATGCCLLMPQKAVKKVGLLREEFFMYCEDNDYSIRLQKNNVRIIYTPTACLWHKVSASSGGEMSKFICYYVIRNRFYCAKINRLGVRTKLYLYLETGYRFLKALAGKYHRNYIIAPKSIIDYWAGNMGKQNL